MTKEQLQAAHPKCQKGLIPLLEKPRVFVLSKVITQFYIESFISKELEILLYQNVNYQRHSHHRVETCLLSRSSCPGHSQSVQSQGETAGWAASDTLQESMASVLLSTFFPPQALSSLGLNFFPSHSDFTWQLLPSPTLRPRLKVWHQKGPSELKDT